MSCRQLPLDLSSKAEIARGRVLADIPRHLWPPVISAYQFQRFPPSGVSGYQAVVMEGYDLPADVRSRRYIDLSVEVEDAFNF